MAEYIQHESYAAANIQHEYNAAANIQHESNAAANFQHESNEAANIQYESNEAAKKKAKGMLFNVAEGIIKNLGNRAVQEIGLVWGSKDELLKLTDKLITIKGVLPDAEEQLAQNQSVRDMLENLKSVVDEADVMVKDISTEALRREEMTRNKKAKKLRIFFSKSNQIAYGLKMAHKIKAIRERLDVITGTMAEFNFVVRIVTPAEPLPAVPSVTNTP